MRYVLVAILTLCLFLPASADSLVAVSLEAHGVSGVVCFSGAITSPVVGGEITEFCTGAGGVASINLPAWVPYRITEKVPPGYMVSRIECSGSGKYRTGGSTVTINVQGDAVSCTFNHVARFGSGVPLRGNYGK